MNLKTELLNFLASIGATTRESNGILYVTMPDGRVWDMTTPQLSAQ